MVCLLLLVMLVTGVFASFWFWTVKYAAAYVTQNPLTYVPTAFMRSFSVIAAAAPALWAAAGIGVLFLPFTRDISRRHKRFIILLALFSLLSICPGFHFRPHYFVLLLPCAGLLCGAAAFAIRRRLSASLSNSLSCGILLLVGAVGIGQSVWLQSDYLFRMTPLQICRSTFGPNPFHESLAVAAYLQEHTTPEDTIAVLGSEPQLFFYSQRRSVSEHIYMYPLMERHSFAREMQQNFIGKTESKTPKYIVYVNISTSWLADRGSPTLLFEWVDTYLDSNYHLAGTVELLRDRSVYRWDRQVQWPPSSPYWLAVYERNQE